MLDTIIGYIPPTWVLLLISGVIIMYSFTRKNNNFFDVRIIFKEHFAIFNKNVLQIIVFYVVPLVLALGIVKAKIIDKDIINNLNIVLSILLSMLFAMLSILTSLPNKKPENKADTNYGQLLKETFNTILFECIICVFLLVVSFIELFINDFCVSWQLSVVSIVIYYFSLIIILNIFIVLKRLKNYLTRDKR